MQVLVSLGTGYWLLGRHPHSQGLKLASSIYSSICHAFHLAALNIHVGIELSVASTASPVTVLSPEVHLPSSQIPDLYTAATHYSNQDLTLLLVFAFSSG